MVFVGVFVFDVYDYWFGGYFGGDVNYWVDLFDGFGFEYDVVDVDVV